jgi:bacterioferritin
MTSVEPFLLAASMRENLFLHDIRTLRSRVQHRIHVEPVREQNEAENVVVIKLLNDLLATELVCAQRYRRYQFLDADTRHKISVDEIKAHSDQEQRHIALIAERITELGGEPDLSPQGLASTCASYCMDGKVLVDLIKEDIIAECIAMDVYRDAIRHLGDRDPTTTDMMLEILQDEEHHTAEMATLLEQLPA